MLNRFHICLSVVFTIPSAGAKLRTIPFCGLRVKSKMVNSNVPHLRSPVSVNRIEIIVQVRILNLSSVRSNEHMMALFSALCERSDYKLVHLNFRSYNGEIVKPQSAVNDDYNNFSGKI